DRAGSCVVRTGTYERQENSYGLVVPTPFLYPLEGVPAFLDAKLVPSGGICVGGDNSAARCDEQQECEGGYCELHGAHAYTCFDAPAPGNNPGTVCSRTSQCPYGRCYAHDDALDQHGAYPALAEYLLTD